VNVNACGVGVGAVPSGELDGLANVNACAPLTPLPNESLAVIVRLKATPAVCAPGLATEIVEIVDAPTVTRECARVVVDRAVRGR